jgi:hypothetical protein
VQKPNIEQDAHRQSCLKRAKDTPEGSGSCGNVASVTQKGSGRCAGRRNSRAAAATPHRPSNSNVRGSAHGHVHGDLHALVTRVRCQMRGVSQCMHACICACLHACMMQQEHAPRNADTTQAMTTTQEHVAGPGWAHRTDSTTLHKSRCDRPFVTRQSCFTGKAWGGREATEQSNAAPCLCLQDRLRCRRPGPVAVIAASCSFACRASSPISSRVASSAGQYNCQ